MTRTRRLAAVFAAGSLALLSVAGVASAAPAPMAPKPDPIKQALLGAQAKMVAPTKIFQTIPLKSKPPTGKLVMYMNSGCNPSSNLISAGVEEAAKVLGWSFEQTCFVQSNPATLQQAMMNALQKNPVGVITGGVDEKLWGDSVTKAYADAKVPIIAGSTCPVNRVGSLFPGGSTCANNGPIGKALADWFIADSGGKGSILLQSMPIYNVYVVFREGFKAEVARLCPACKVQIQDVTLQDLAAGRIPSLLVNTLRANPDIGYLFFDNAAWSGGIMPALQAAGLGGRIKVGGQAVDDNALKFLKARAQVVWSANAFKVYGYASTDSLLRVITGSTGITKNSAIPFQLLTPANADTVELPYKAPETALAQYMKLWKLS